MMASNAVYHGGVSCNPNKSQHQKYGKIKDKVMYEESHTHGLILVQIKNSSFAPNKERYNHTDEVMKKEFT